MTCNAFIASLKIQSNNFRSEVIRTSNEFTYLEGRFNELHQKAVPIFKNHSEKDAQLLSARRHERENRRLIQQCGISNKQKKIFIVTQQNSEQNNCNHNYNRSVNGNYHNEGDEPRRRRRVPAPCKVMPFVTEKYSPFTANVCSSSKIAKSFPSPFSPQKPPSQSPRAQSEMLSASRTGENYSGVQVWLPRVALL